MPSQFQNLGDLINRDRDMTKLAVVDLGGEETPCEYCYAELDAMTTGVGRGLATRGFARGDRIVILSDNRVEFIAAYFGIMRAGLVAVPVNYRFPKKTIDFIVHDAAQSWCSATRQRRARSCGLAHVVSGATMNQVRTAFAIRGSKTVMHEKPREPACSIQRARRGRRASCYRTGAILGGWRRGSSRSRRSLSDRGALIT